MYTVVPIASNVNVQMDIVVIQYENLLRQESQPIKTKRISYFY